MNITKTIPYRPAQDVSQVTLEFVNLTIQHESSWEVKGYLHTPAIVVFCPQRLGLPFKRIVFEGWFDHLCHKKSPYISCQQTARKPSTGETLRMKSNMGTGVLQTLELQLATHLLGCFRQAEEALCAQGCQSLLIPPGFLHSTADRT